MPKRLPNPFRRQTRGIVIPPGTQPADVSPQSQITGADSGWFPPLQPIAPFAPAGTKPRRLGYNVGQNKNIVPRAGRVTPATLRNLADNWPLLRLVIETCKDQICRVQWTIRAIERPGEDARTRQRREASDQNIIQLKQFFAYPDGERPWGTWLRSHLEDLFVLDAWATYLERDVTGRIAALQQLDGATIVRLIDPTGETPAPPQPAYQQTVHGLPAQNLTTDDLLYAMYNERSSQLYGFPQVEQLLLDINTGLRRSIMQLGFYTSGNTPEALVFVPDAPLEQIRRFEEHFNSMLSGNLQRRNQIKFLPTLGSGKPEIVFPKQNALADEFDDVMVRRVCYAFSVSPSALQKPMNRASAEQTANSAEEEGQRPKLVFIKSLLDKIIQTKMGMSGYEFAWATERDPDIEKQAGADKIYVSAAVRTPNEIRGDQGLPPIEGQPEADMLGVVTATGFVPLGQAQQQAAPAAAPKPEADDQPKKKPPKAGSRGTAQKAAGAPRDPEQDLESAIAETFHAQERAVDRELSGTTKADNDGKMTDAQRDALLAALLQKVEIEWELLPGDAEPALAQAAAKSALDGSTSTGAFVGFARTQEAARAMAKERAAEMVGMKRDADGNLIPNPDARYAISDTTRDSLREIFAEHPDLLQGDLIQAIKDAGIFSDARARMIANTEIKTIGQRVNLEAWKNSGVVEKVKWNLSSIEPHCIFCIERAAEPPKPIDDAEIPPLHPNCRCYMTVAKFVGDDEEQPRKGAGFAGRKHSPETKARIAATMKARAEARKLNETPDAQP
ncbi:MAG: hypothetical protein ACRD2H_05825 [Terriglobales bacterium]